MVTYRITDTRIRIHVKYLVAKGDASGTLEITTDHVSFKPDFNSTAKLLPEYNLYFELEDLLEPEVHTTLPVLYNHKIPVGSNVVELRQILVFGIVPTPETTCSYYFLINAHEIDAVVAFFLTHLEAAKTHGMRTTDRPATTTATATTKTTTTATTKTTTTTATTVSVPSAPLAHKPSYDWFHPTLMQHSQLLNSDEIRTLTKHIPAQLRQCDWNLTFNTKENGFNINTFYRNFTGLEERPSILVFRDMSRNVFGAFTSCGWKKSDGYFGSGECFLFKLRPEVKFFPWSGLNRYFMNGTKDSISMGGGDREARFSLWVDATFYRGSSDRSQTFENEPLSSKKDFLIENVEAWSLLTSGF